MRFPRHVYGHGSEPDPRFTLANERTFLAWIRTALALVAGGVALAAIPLPLAAALKLAAALLLLAMGLVIPPLAWWHWAATERALRHDRPLPGSVVSIPLAAGLVGVTGLVAVGLLT